MPASGTTPPPVASSPLTSFVGRDTEVSGRLALKVSCVQVVHDSVDGLAAHGDGASPRRAEGEQQGHAEPDHYCEPADQDERETIATETRRAILENFPPASAYVEVEPPRADPSPHRICHTGTAGVITATDLHGLAELCRQKECWLELTVGVGEYLAHGTLVALVHGGDLQDRDVTRFFLIRGERTFVQDPAFGFRQLVDTAIRALSPAVNDPTTGVQAIDRICDLLAITGGRLDPTGLRVDSAGTVRVKRKLRNFDALLVLALTEVIRYGADAPQVVRRLRGAFDELESTLPEERHAAIARQRALLDAAASAALPAPFAAVSSTADREGLG